MTAERSLEIITEQIARSRKAVSQLLAKNLIVSGIATIAMSLLIGILVAILETPLPRLLWLVLPFVIWWGIHRNFKQHESQPGDIISSMVGKTWLTFAMFALGFFVLAIAWNRFTVTFDEPSHRMFVHIGPVLMLLMGVAIAMTGFVLKNNVLVTFGVIGGLLMYFWDTFNLAFMVLARMGVEPQTLVWMDGLLCAIPVTIFAVVGLLIPGLALKRQTPQL